MSPALKCVMLIDDSADDNFYHERVIKKTAPQNIVITKNSGEDALEYLKSKTEPRSDLIFLDINMPGMNGWDFLKEYDLLDQELQGRAIIIMLTTSDNPDDLAKARASGIISEYITKPLTREIMTGIVEKYFG